MYTCLYEYKCKWRVIETRKKILPASFLGISWLLIWFSIFSFCLRLFSWELLFSDILTKCFDMIFLGWILYLFIWDLDCIQLERGDCTTVDYIWIIWYFSPFFFEESFPFYLLIFFLLLTNLMIHSRYIDYKI
jgi:hypothetical protein